ncbi:MAG: amidohydrolase family protein [Pyrinomonadaceae bacterium]
MRDFFAFLLTILLSASAIAQNSAGQSLVLTHVTVIDMTGAPPKPDQTVIITGNRITALGKSAEISVPRNSQVVDATGMFLIPGLWDMHVHLNYETVRQVEQSLFPLFIANGVTSVRDMWNLHDVEGMKQIRKWRERIAAGELTAPRLAAVGRGIDGVAGGNAYIRVKDVREARMAVQRIKHEGYDFVKIYSNLSRESFFAIADEAKKQNIPFAGHVPLSVGAVEASDAGMRSMEHLFETLTPSSTIGEELKKQELALNEKFAALNGKPPTPELEEASRRLTERFIDTYSDKKAANLFARFVQNDTWQCPTLVIYQIWAAVDNKNLFNDARINYVPLNVRTKDKQYFDAMLSWSEKEISMRKKLYQLRLRQVNAAHRAGVKFLAGTDATSTFPVHGFSLHDELALFVQAGLTPMEALQTATINPAKFLALADSLGTIEKGKFADLVLLDANPLAHINNTKKISAVIINGRFLRREKLDKILADVEAAANKT